MHRKVRQSRIDQQMLRWHSFVLFLHKVMDYVLEDIILMTGKNHDTYNLLKIRQKRYRVSVALFHYRRVTAGVS